MRTPKTSRNTDRKDKMHSDANQNDNRYIRETGQEAGIASLLAPVAADLGYAVVRVRITPENGCTLQIMAERPDGTFTITDCETLSREINPVLDVEDPIDSAYHLEVSSPGIDRVLVRARDFARWQGHEAKIELAVPQNGRKRFRGILAASDETSVTVTLPDAPEGEARDRVLAFADLAEAKLVLTDALLAAAAAMQANDPALNDPDIETIEDTRGTDT